MKKASEFTFIVFLIGASLLAACSQSAASTSEPGTPSTMPVPLTVTMPVPFTADTPVPLPEAGALVPGTYFLAKGPGSNTDYQRIIFTLPAGWAIKYGLVFKNLDQPGMVAFSAWNPDKVYADPCHWQKSALGPLDLANHYDNVSGAFILTPADGGLANQAFRGPVPPTLSDVMIGGERALRIDLSVPPDLDISSCDRGEFRSFTAHGPVGGANYHHISGQLDAVYMVGLDRGPMVIDALHMPAASEADLAELDAILASMIIDRGDSIDALNSASFVRNGDLGYLSIEPDVAAVVQGTLLDPGTYTYVNVDGHGFNVRFTVPASWTWNGRYLSKGGFDQPDRAAIFFFGGPAQVYTDPCAWGAEPQSISTFSLTDGSMNKLMTALVDQPMRSATAPISRSANGLSVANRWPGMAVELTTRDDFNFYNCYAGQYRSWAPEINFRSHVDPGQRDFIWALDTTPPGPGGLIIDAASFPGTPDDVMAEIESILESIVVGHWG